MYKQLSRAHPRDLGGHVCLSCRRQLHVRRQLFVAQQRRYQQHSAAPSSSTDDWIDNFNDLSASAPSPSSKFPPKSTAPADEDGSKKTDQTSPDASATFEALRSNVQTVKDGKDGSDTGRDKATRRERFAKKMERALSESRQREPRQTANASRPRESAKGKSRTRERNTERHQKERAESVQATSSPDASMETNVESSPASEERSRFEQILANIDAPKAETSDTEPVPAKSRKETLFGERPVDPQFAFTKHLSIASDDVPVAQGQVSETIDGTQNMAAPPATEQQPPGSATPVPNFFPPSQDQEHNFSNLASKARMVRDRPKWGGLTVTPHKTVDFKASFDTLREADQVSPPSPTPSTASAAKPWGLETRELFRQPDDVPAPPAKSQSSQSSRSLGGMFGFKRLKQMLYGEPGDPKKKAAERPQIQTVSPPKTTAASEGAAISTSIDPSSPGMTSASGGDNLEKASREANDPVDALWPSERLAGLYGRRGPFKDDQPEKPDRDDRARDSEHTKPAKRSGATLRRARSRARRMEKERERHAGAARKRELEEPESQAEAMSAAGSPDVPQPQSDSAESGQSLWQVMQGQQFADALESNTKSSSSAIASNRAPDPSALASGAVLSDPGDLDDLGAVLDVVDAKGLEVTALNVKQPPVPPLAHGLDRVLFNPGVYQLQDPHSRVHNFDPYLQDIMPVTEFDFNALKEYKTSSQDKALSDIASKHGKKYIGSTSSMTSTLGHFHYLLSNWRDINLNMLSRGFQEERSTFTNINRAPTAIFLRYKNGTYAVDADKEFDSGNVLMMLGKSMEKLLTMPKSEYERYRKSDSREVSEEERNAPEAFEYTTMGDFLMRSQLDAYDQRLPGNGTFDIKTRAVISIRMDTTDYVPMLGYQIHTLQGHYESYEREYYDMLRSTMLKYMLQARMGRMDGIFLTYHNVQRIFGFQYLTISEIDRAMHGQIDQCLGDQEFRVSLDLLNKVFDQATAKFPGKSLRFHFETRATPVVAMYIFAEPMEEEEIDRIQSKSKDKIAQFEREMMGFEKEDKPATAEEPEQTESAAADPGMAAETETGTQESATKTGALQTQDFSTSDSQADQPWFDAVTQQTSQAPLYAATLIIHSTVNGESVERPSHLKPSDEWSVEYMLKEIEPSYAWATYVQTKANRKKAFDFTKSVNDEGEAEEGVPEVNEFIEMLKRFAREGREFRGRMDKLERDRRPVVFREGEGTGGQSEDKSGAEAGEVESSASSESCGMPVAPQSPEPAAETRVDDTAKYMEWLYKNREVAVHAPPAAAAPQPQIDGTDSYMEWLYQDRKA